MIPLTGVLKYHTKFLFTNSCLEIRSQRWDYCTDIVDSLEKPFAPGLAGATQSSVVGPRCVRLNAKETHQRRHNSVQRLVVHPEVPLLQLITNKLVSEFDR